MPFRALLQEFDPLRRFCPGIAEALERRIGTNRLELGLYDIPATIAREPVPPCGGRGSARHDFARNRACLEGIVHERPPFSNPFQRGTAIGIAGIAFGQNPILLQPVRDSSSARYWREKG
jgi:hypothetical protein